MYMQFCGPLDVLKLKGERFLKFMCHFNNNLTFFDILIGQTLLSIASKLVVFREEIKFTYFEVNHLKSSSSVKIRNKRD